MRRQAPPGYYPHLKMQYPQGFFLFTVTTKALDAFAVVAAWYLTWFLRFYSHWLPAEKGIPNFATYSEMGLPLALVFFAVFHMVGAYRRDRILFGFRSLKKIAQGVVLGTLVFVSFLYFIEAVHFSRLYLALFTAVCGACLLLTRLALFTGWRYAVSHWLAPLRLVLVGYGDLLHLYHLQINRRKPYPVSWIGRFAPKETATGFSEVPYLGEEKDLVPFLSRQSVDSVIVSYPTKEQSAYLPILENLQNELVEVKLLPDFGHYSTFTYRADQECGIPLLGFNHPPLGNSDRAIKRAFDIIGSFLFLVLGSPVFLAIAIATKLSSRGPIFYSQVRMGADGRVFPLYKFRSMRVGAENQTGAVWAKANDDRVTPLGKFLRRTSLDELPQFYNVLKGDMSLVGPRPERPVFVEQFRKEVPRYMLRHKIRSGITGWAQVNGWRGNTSIDERIKHDLFYIGHWSHLLDFKILVLTVFKGFVNKNAY